MLISGNLPLSKPCPCGSGDLLSQCCGVYLQGQLAAPTAEKLMRSRYTAYCLKNIDYLFNTEHPNRREPNSRKLITATANNVKWIGLTVVSTAAGQAKNDTGVVEFVAVYQEGHQVAQLHERSQFIKENGKWFYTEGEMLSPIQPKKNEPCWCHSGKKFKQCHGKKR
ncbi:YchJ family protein [[Limnothrix rosea] IAM M-220]|uniref:YchJ family protein n=1 Tax=[Limnothrix rosea] IAM M-220 TaxID=454133 RepID=UPI0009652E5E|nr:YchJ family protein [[Limnothrix rosea] IAM M-220]OKH14674.1 zinc chelation protein SecC [[Limnothrix rosea] IAM M-220]